MLREWVKRGWPAGADAYAPLHVSMKLLAPGPFTSIKMPQ